MQSILFDDMSRTNFWKIDLEVQKTSLCSWQLLAKKSRKYFIQTLQSLLHVSH